jgi:hypothetical protein
MHISFQQVVANQATVVEKINVSSFAFCSKNELLNLVACSKPLHHAQWHHLLCNMGSETLLLFNKSKSFYL